MSESHEPSYYEIALTNRQVVGVFVVLLVCLVAAFFSGVWIGRRELPPATAGVAELGAAGDAEPAADAPPPRRLRFFEEEQGAGEPAAAEPGRRSGRRPAVEEPRPDRTLLEEVGGSTGAPPARPSAGQGAAEPAPPAARTPPSGPTPAGGEAADPPGGPSGEPTGELVIQVFSSLDEVQARRLVERLGGGGYPAYLSPVDVAGRTMYRVRVGPYDERAQAEIVAEKVRRAFKLDTWITE